MAWKMYLVNELIAERAPNAFVCLCVCVCACVCARAFLILMVCLLNRNQIQRH